MTETNFIIIILICGTALFIDILLLVDSYSTFISKVIEVIKIKHMLLAGVFQTTIYLIEFILYLLHFNNIRFLGMFLESMLYIGNMVYVLAFADFVYVKYQKKLYNINVNRLLFLSPTFILIIIDIINIFYPIFYNITPNTFTYVETPWVIFANLIPASYVLFAGINDIKEVKRELHFYNLPISLYFLPSMLGMIIESFFYDIPIVPIACSISMMVMYMRILRQIGYIDNLSGLFTRSQMTIYINSLLGKRSSKKMIAGIMIDVNRFKNINDTYGHLIGDEAIRVTGSILKKATKKNGLCFRYGGDEFVIILNVSDMSQVVEIIDSINIIVSEFNEQKSQVFSLSFSEGYTIYDTKNDSVLTFIERLDSEMYKDKRLSHRSILQN